MNEINTLRKYLSWLVEKKVDLEFQTVEMAPLYWRQHNLYEKEMNKTIKRLARLEVLEEEIKEMTK